MLSLAIDTEVCGIRRTHLDHAAACKLKSTRIASNGNTKPSSTRSIISGQEKRVHIGADTFQVPIDATRDLPQSQRSRAAHRP
jgi:hypothetical protein